MDGKAIKVLLVEDNPGDARLIREMLAEAWGRGLDLEWVPRLADGLERLNRGEIDLVLLDLDLPDSSGLDTFVKAHAQAPQVPFVVLTGLADETLALTAFRNGAQDYLFKGEINPQLLRRAIRYSTERKQAELAIEAERKKLFAVLNSLPAFVHLKGADFKIGFANRRFQEVFGNPGNNPCYELLRGRSEPCEDCHSGEVLKTKVPQQFEWTNADNTRTYEVYHYPFCSGDDLQVLTLGIDITARNQAQQKLRESEENLRYLASQLLTSQERERKRISRELHDSAAQELSALKIGLENLLADSPERPVEEFNLRISQLLQKLQRTLTSIRTLSYDLRPPDLEHFGLVQAIKTQCEEFTARTDIKVDFMAAGIEAGHLDDDAAINLYRIIHEGLTNVWRHAQAMNVNVRLVASFPKIILRLEDDGQGFDVMEQEASRHGDKHLGLLGMRERVALLGGEIKIESQLTKGTKISIEIPWKGEHLDTKEEAPHC